MALMATGDILHVQKNLLETRLRVVRVTLLVHFIVSTLIVLTLAA